MTEDPCVCSQVDVLLKEVQERFEHVFDLHESIFVMDATSVTSPALKHLKGYLSETKVKVTQVSPPVHLALYRDLSFPVGSCDALGVIANPGRCASCDRESCRSPVGLNNGHGGSCGLLVVLLTNPTAVRRSLSLCLSNTHTQTARTACCGATPFVKLPVRLLFCPDKTSQLSCGFCRGSWPPRSGA